jgi:serine/threonine-protein kinase RsbW
MPDSTLVLRSPDDDVDLLHAFLDETFAQVGVTDPQTRMAFETALVELVGNVIQHADDGAGITCRLTVREDHGDLMASITDSAEPGGFTLSRREMPDALAESGRGLALVQLLVDDLHYEQLDGHNHWIIRKRHRSS